MGKHTNIVSFSWLCSLVFYYLSYTGRKKIKEIESIRIQFPYYLKRKLLYRFVVTLISIFFAAHNSNAQETTVTDTVLQVVPPDEENVAEYDEETDEEQFYQDTLRPNFRSVVYDSVQAIIADKGFYYKRYMDSLLRATQAKSKKSQNAELIRIDFFNSIFGIIFWIVAIGLFVYLVYRLFLSNSSVFSRKSEKFSC